MWMRNKAIYFKSNMIKEVNFNKNQKIRQKSKIKTDF